MRYKGYATTSRDEPIDVNKFLPEWRELIIAHLYYVQSTCARQNIRVVLDKDINLLQTFSFASGKREPVTLNNFPSLLYPDGTYQFLNGSVAHRSGDLPTWCNTDPAWEECTYAVNDRAHRYIGPASMQINHVHSINYKSWIINGIVRRKKSFARHASGVMSYISDAFDTDNNHNFRHISVG